MNAASLASSRGDVPDVCLRRIISAMREISQFVEAPTAENRRLCRVPRLSRHLDNRRDRAFALIADKQSATSIQTLTVAFQQADPLHFIRVSFARPFCPDMFHF
jgi:hypothetical protein